MDANAKALVWDELKRNDGLVLDLALLFISCRKAGRRPDHDLLLDVFKQNIEGGNGTAPTER